MFLPEFLYKCKPHLLTGVGTWSAFAFDNTLGIFSGGVLLVAAGLIYWARSR